MPQTPYETTRHLLQRCKDALKRLEPVNREQMFREMARDEREKFHGFWPLWSRAEQMPPLSSDWRHWLMMGGRGAGKTRSGAEWLRGIALESPYFQGDSAGRLAIVGENLHDVRTVMIEGESGLLAIHAPMERPVWSPTLRRLEWPNGVIGEIFSANDPESLRGSQFGAAWCDEAGCPAVNRGTNQPNVFVDQKSDQSALPRFSNGGRDDLIQYRYLSAMLDFWADAGSEANPVSSVYGGPMVSPDDIWFWTWDARPFPDFPLQLDTWSDGVNWHTGHWLNGRLGGCPVNELIDTILADFNIEAEPTAADGFIDGYVIGEVNSVRSMIEPLMGVFNLAVREHDGKLQIFGKEQSQELELSSGHIVDEIDGPSIVRKTLPEVDLPREVSISHGDLFKTYGNRVSASRRLETGSEREMSMTLPASISPGMAGALAESRLRDIWVARNRISFGLPWRFAALEAGDIIHVPHELSAHHVPPVRIDRIEHGNHNRIEAGRIARFEESQMPGLVESSDAGKTTGYGAPEVVLFNLPVNNEVTEAQPGLYAAMYADPWAGRYLVSSSPGLTGFLSQSVITRQAMILSLEQDLNPGPIGRWDWSNEIIVQGNQDTELASRDELAVLTGENAIAVECNNGEWELIQFTNAELAGLNLWRLTGLLRGQAGSDPAMSAGAVTGARAVFINRAVKRLPVRASAVGLEQNWQFVPFVAGQGLDLSLIVVPQVCENLERRPLTPVHLGSSDLTDGSVRMTWIRRGRLDADSWEAAEIPLAESSEKYVVSIRNGTGDEVRSVETGTPAYEYTSSQRVQDLGSASANFTWSAAQIGSSGLPGPFSQFVSWQG